MIQTEYFLVGLAHTELIVPANGPAEALTNATTFRDAQRDGRNLFGYESYDLPEMREIDPHVRECALRVGSLITRVGNIQERNYALEPDGKSPLNVKLTAESLAAEIGYKVGCLLSQQAQYDPQIQLL